MQAVSAAFRHSKPRGALRPVTTNFDSHLPMARQTTGQTFKVYAAPMLPYPQEQPLEPGQPPSRLTTRKVDDTVLNRLVVTSGDFGLAYLTERWAARFVSELFRQLCGLLCRLQHQLSSAALR